jgi:hypothetical protein
MQRGKDHELVKRLIFCVRYVCADQERWVEIEKDAEKKDDGHTSCSHRYMNMNRPCAIESSDAELTQRLVAYSFCPQLGWPHVSQFGQRFNSSVPCNECRVVPCLGFERHDLESKSRLSMAQIWTGDGVIEFRLSKISVNVGFSMTACAVVPYSSQSMVRVITFAPLAAHHNTAENIAAQHAASQHNTITAQRAERRTSAQCPMHRTFFTDSSSRAVI